MWTAVNQFGLPLKYDRSIASNGILLSLSKIKTEGNSTFRASTRRLNSMVTNAPVAPIARAGKTVKTTFSEARFCHPNHTVAARITMKTVARKYFRTAIRTISPWTIGYGHLFFLSIFVGNESPTNVLL